MRDRMKLSNLKDIEKRDTMMLCYTDKEMPRFPEQGKDYRNVLHIYVAEGRDTTGHGYHHAITKCNRVLETHSCLTAQSIDDAEYRICPKCGDRTEFDNVLAEWHINDTKWREERRIKQEQEDKDNHERWEAQKHATTEFMAWFLKTSIEFQPKQDKYGNEFVIQYQGMKYKVTCQGK